MHRHNSLGNCRRPEMLMHAIVEVKIDMAYAPRSDLSEEIFWSSHSERLRQRDFQSWGMKSRMVNWGRYDEMGGGGGVTLLSICQLFREFSEHGWIVRGVISLSLSVSSVSLVPNRSTGRWLEKCGKYLFCTIWCLLFSFTSGAQHLWTVAINTCQKSIFLHYHCFEHTSSWF